MEAKGLARYYRSRHSRYHEMLSWKGHLPELGAAVREVLPDAKVFIFGSALKGGLVGDSDVDVLVVVPRGLSVTEKGVASLSVENRLSEPRIFELHITDRAGLAWYRKHAKELTPLQELAASR